MVGGWNFVMTLMCTTQLAEIWLDGLVSTLEGKWCS